jgi:hydroxymethylpyrimidine pyrophosphatase-like HAD family hydrolase
VVIVTGRRWESLASVVPSVVELCHRVVGEEGGVLVDVALGRVELLAEPLEENLLAALQAAGVPDLDVGHVVLGGPVSFLEAMTAARDSVGSTRRVVVNKGSCALTPPGCDKASGLGAAIRSLGAEGVPIVAIGDAANDLPMFAMATFPYGVANADDAVRSSGVPLTWGAAGLGVAEALQRHRPI